jgi:hypothetical protein
MSNQRKMNEFRWPFAKHRITWVAEADRISDEAASFYAEGEFAPAPGGIRKMKRAASLYEHAAEFYRKAGLGLAAYNSYECAAEVWSELGDAECAVHCEELMEKIELFWEDEDLCEEDEEDYEDDE